ncbi:Wall-associated kinase family protein [Euphorbia peplus]|nr:Wall-associated kinase family protein [Euphorbia peplus]
MEKTIQISTSSLLKLLHVVCLIQALAVASSSSCEQTCGTLWIYFPFGTGQGCYLNPNFDVFCNYSFSPPKLFLTILNMEVDVILSAGQVRVWNPVISSNCNNTKSYNSTGISLLDTPFMFSNDSNKFTAVGCNNYAMLLAGQTTEVLGGCLSACPYGAYNNVSGCYGINCCEASIPPNMQAFQVNMTNPFTNVQQDRSTCKSAFMVHQSWFARRLSTLRSYDDLNQLDNVPVMLDWGIDQGYCDIRKAPNVNCTLDQASCWKYINPNQLCICNPCQDFGRCTDPSNYMQCRLVCLYTSGGYNCSCPPGHTSNDAGTCYPDHVIWGKSQPNTKIIIIGVVSGVGFLLLLIGLWLLYKLVKRRQAEKLKHKFFKRNGGLLFEQQLSSTENHVEKTKLFTSKELETATDGYNVNRILGHGGQGTVYKGMLTDGRVVAVKKSKVVDEDKLDQFINEVVILSQINHRNVVKLYGCCLETEVPLLVYEFISNGTLYQFLHSQNEDEFQVTWKMRLQIATEVAGALAYLHSAASMPIYHRDIKTSNILLDEKYRAKVADFGTSKSISIDDTHVTTRVQGTFGYLDPEYFQSSQFTDKSDVYSFGVVLVELLTGQKPIILSREERSLATYFLLSMEENRLFDIVDGRVLKEAKKDEMIAIAKLAKSCLNLNGKRRPNMKTVAIELERIKACEGVSSMIEQEYEEVDYALGDYNGPWEITWSSTRSLTS